jgi:protein HIRA/HIR1
VKIWSTAALNDSAEEEEGGDDDEGSGSENELGASLLDMRMAGASSPPNADQPDERRLLAVLSSHQLPVNCVRWAHSGKHLATGSDDKFIIIWERRASGAPSSVPFGTQKVKNVENWAQAFALTGHTLDVVDLAWSSDDGLIASASLDNTVRVWRVGVNAGSCVAALEGHEGLVKGVAWDPVGKSLGFFWVIIILTIITTVVISPFVSLCHHHHHHHLCLRGPLAGLRKAVSTGKYLASSGEDQRMIIWRTSDWRVETEVKEPFVGSAKVETHFRRIDWAPHGGAICATNATKSGVHVAAHILRGTWEWKIDFVGHIRPVISSRFSPAIYPGALVLGVREEGSH